MPPGNAQRGDLAGQKRDPVRVRLDEDADQTGAVVGGRRDGPEHEQHHSRESAHRRQGSEEAAASAVHLTKRQSEVLELLGEGASTDQIATSLHLSKETVRNYVRQVLRALGAHSRLEAVALAHQDGLLGRED